MDKKKIALLSLGHLSCDVNGGALPAVLPFLREALNLSYQASGGLMFAYSCLSSVIQPLFGLLADRFSRPWFIPLGVLLAGCGMALTGFMASYWAIFAAIVISGIGSSLFHPEGARHANKAGGKSKGTALSIFSIGGNSGFVLGPLLVTGCMGLWGLSGMLAFAVLGVGTASLLLWQICLAKAEPTTATGNGRDKKDTSPARNNWPEFAKLTGVIVTRSTLFISFNAFIPLYWINVFGQSKAAGALAMTIFCASGVLCNIGGGILSDRYGYLRVIRPAFSFMPLVVLAFGMAGNIWLAYALLPLLGCVLYAPFSSMVVLGQKLLAKNIGFASGVTLGLATSMGGMAAPVLGWIADNYGLPNAVRCLALVALAGTFFAWRLSPAAAGEK
ncbi:MAG: MFS transporter [Desulfovibrionaceae bacterium]|nr:MFS transporter [Desulfovibrionaceae bacterium]